VSDALFAGSPVDPLLTVLSELHAASVEVSAAVSAAASVPASAGNLESAKAGQLNSGQQDGQTEG
jgi:hypothetical protein